MPYAAQTIANYLIWRTNNDAEYGENITNLKLQKLLYYAQGFHLAFTGQPLFTESIKAWVHGPVVPAVWNMYRDSGATPLFAPADFDPETIGAEARRSIEEAYSVYGQYSAWGLRNLTHEEAPWRDTPRDGVIPQETMRRYFAENLINA